MDNTLQNSSIDFLNNTIDMLHKNGSPGYYIPPKDSCTLYSRLIIHTIITGGICILGVVGNSISFAVLRKDKQSCVATYLLLVLALADSFFLITCFVQFSIIDIFEFFDIDQYKHRIWIYTRLYTYPFLYLGQMITIWITVLIATTRYIAVCFPFKTPKLCSMLRVKCAVVSISIFAIIYNIPRFLDTKVVNVTDNGHEKYYFDRDFLGKNLTYQLVYIDVLFYIFNFALPLLILVVLNTKLTIAYQRSKQERVRLSSVSSATSRTADDSNITLVMIIVVLVFILCYLPGRIVQIIWQYRDKDCKTVEFFLKEISSVLEVIPSSTNFWIYCAIRKQFRYNLVKWAKSCCCCWKDASSNERVVNVGRRNRTYSSVISSHV